MKRDAQEVGIPATVHGLLAATYSELGRAEEAQAEISESLRVSPDHNTLDSWEQTYPYKNPKDVQRLLVALRKAGLE